MSRSSAPTTSMQAKKHPTAPDLPVLTAGPPHKLPDMHIESGLPSSGDNAPPPRTRTSNSREHLPNSQKPSPGRRTTTREKCSTKNPRLDSRRRQNETCPHPPWIDARRRPPEPRDMHQEPNTIESQVRQLSTQIHWRCIPDSTPLRSPPPLSRHLPCT